MVKVGQKARFAPLAYVQSFGSNDCRGKYVTGTVVYVNEQNQWFSVEYNNPKLRTSFKFSQIGTDVKLYE